MQVPSKDLRWAVGCILAEDDQTPDQSLLKTLQGQGYKTIKLPKADRVTMTTFPYKNLISIYLANYKVWNAYAVYAKVVRRAFSGRICLCYVFLCYFLFFFAILRIVFQRNVTSVSLFYISHAQCGCPLCRLGRMRGCTVCLCWML